MKKFEMRFLILTSLLISTCAYAQTKKHLDFNSYLQENLQIIAHNKKAEKNQLAFDELKTRTPASDGANLDGLKSGNRNNTDGSVWRNLGGSSQYGQQSQDNSGMQGAPAAPAAPTQAAPAASQTSSGDGLPQ